MTEQTNQERAERAYRTLLQGAYTEGGAASIEEAITDLTDGIDDGEYTDTARLTQLAAIVRAAIVADMDGGTIEEAKR